MNKTLMNMIFCSMVKMENKGYFQDPFKGGDNSRKEVFHVFRRLWK